MKRYTYISAILLVFSLTAIHAQQYNREFLQAKVQKYSNMKRTGILMTTFGGISVIGGVITMANADWTKTSEGGNVNYTSHDSNALLGMVLTGVGAGLIGGGIPLSIIGHKKSLRYKKKLNELTLIPFYNNNQAGVNLCYRF